MDRQAIIEKTEKILTRLEEIDAERLELLEDLKATIPIKLGDKVQIMKRIEGGEDEAVRFAFVWKIEVRMRGNERNARLEFDLMKCNKNGYKSDYSDNLNYGEYITALPTQQEDTDKSNLEKAIRDYPIGTKFTSLFGADDEVVQPVSGKTHYANEGDVYVYSKRGEYRMIFDGTWATIFK